MDSIPEYHAKKTVKTNVIILDIHPAADSRVNRHVAFLLYEGYPVYRIHINRFYPSLQEGPFSNHGEMGYRINFFDTKNSRKNSILYNIYALTILQKKVREALRVLDWKEESNSIFHVHDPSLLLVAKKMTLICRTATIVYDRHEVYEHGKKHFGLTFPCIERLYEVLSKRVVRGVITVSEGYISACKGLFPHAVIKAVPNFPNSSDYNTRIIDEKIKSFITDPQINMVYFGSLDHHYDRDIALILKISDQILADYPRTNVYIGGRTGDQALINDFAQLSKKYPGRFHFTGFLPRSEVIRITEKAHLGCCLLKPDTCYWVKISPNKVFEYLMCGTIPIIRADVDYADIFSKCSLIFDRYASEAEVISSIGSLIQQPERMLRMMKEALEVRKNFLYEIVAVRYIQLYQEIQTPLSHHHECNRQAEQ
jgi:hypothetical protein